jgi:molecular chaperone GrpE (heat shock protein)
MTCSIVRQFRGTKFRVHPRLCRSSCSGCKPILSTFDAEQVPSPGRQLKTAPPQIMTVLLPVIDDFDRALAAETLDAAYAEGVRLTYRHLLGVLENLGLEQIRAVGEVFDPYVHEAVTRVMTADAPEGTVVEEFRKGYRLRDGRLLRPAQVSVAASPD